MYPVISLGNDLNIPTYTLVISLVYCVCIYWAMKRAGQLNLDRAFSLDLSLAIMIFGFVGARLLHIIYEQPGYYLDEPLDIFKVWQGGFVYYGGAIGAFLGCLWWIRRKGAPFGPWADLFAPVVALGYALGRIACFLNGCCYGKLCDLPWGVQFENLESHTRHPTQLYAFLFEITLMFLLLYMEKKKRFGYLKTAGNLFFTWIFFHGFGRLFMEVFRDDFRGDKILGLSISMWISIILILSGGFQIFRAPKKS